MVSVRKTRYGTSRKRRRRGARGGVVSKYTDAGYSVDAQGVLTLLDYEMMTKREIMERRKIVEERIAEYEDEEERLNDFIDRKGWKS